MRIYFAGKISQSKDWRAELFGSDIGATTEYDQPTELFDSEYVQDQGGGVIYGGPFFISCDHGCAHSPSGHGVGANRLDLGSGNRRSLGSCSDLAKESGQPYTRTDVFQINNIRIRKADWIFAYIDSFTAYGTLIEIGFARASSIPIAVAFSSDLHNHGDVKDLWYARESASRVYSGAPKETFHKFCRNVNLGWRPTA